MTIIDVDMEPDKFKRHAEDNGESRSKDTLPAHIQSFITKKNKDLDKKMHKYELTGHAVVKKVDFGFDLWVLLDRYDSTLEEKVRQLFSFRGKFQYFMTNLYVFFLAICKDLDFMSWLLILRIGFQTNDLAIFMMLVWSIIGWLIGLGWFAYKARRVWHEQRDCSQKYLAALKLKQQIGCNLLKEHDYLRITTDRNGMMKLEDRLQKRKAYTHAMPKDDLVERWKSMSKEQRQQIMEQKSQEIDKAIMEYKLLYGDPEGRKVYTVPQWFNIVPMFGVVTLLNFYMQENHDELVARLFRASALRTLILVNTWSTISITIPCAFVITFRFTYGGTTIAEADMFTFFSMAQAFLSIVLTFTAMGLPGFEDTVVRILKDADQISSERALAQDDNRTMYVYFRKWHKVLAVMVSHFRVAQIGVKQPNGQVNAFPDVPAAVYLPIWRERLSENWVLNLLAKCDKVGGDIDYLPDKSHNIYLEKYLRKAIQHVQDAYKECMNIIENSNNDEKYVNHGGLDRESTHNNKFWQKVAKLYAVSTVLITDAADRVLNLKTLLSLDRDVIETKVDTQFLKLTREAEYKTALNYLQKRYPTKFSEQVVKKQLKEKRLAEKKQAGTPLNQDPVDPSD